MKKQLIQSVPTEGLKNGTHLDIEVFYDKGGCNMFGGYTQRGYYVSVTPVHRNGGIVRSTMSSGASKLLLETARYSEKQFRQVVTMSEAVIPGLIQCVLAKERAA